MTVYMDNAATSFRKPERVYRAMDEANRRLSVNAGRGSYAVAREAGALMEDTRERLKALVKAPAEARAVLTPSATLAFNEIIGGIPFRDEDVVYVSPYEHNAVMRTLYGYKRRFGFSIQELPLCPGSLDIDTGRTAYQFSVRPPSYLFLTCVSNVTGYILPVRELCALAREYGAGVILDGAQSLGSIPLDMEELEADVVVFAGHKALHGPFGAGGFLMLPSFDIEPALFGGTGTDSLNLKMPAGMERLEPGSPNITAAAGLHAALEELEEGETSAAFRERERLLTERLIDGLRKIQGVILYNDHDKAAQSGILSINLQGYLAHEVGVLLDLDYDISVRTGYHCAPLIHSRLRDREYTGTVRISPDGFNTVEEADRLLGALEEIAYR